MKRLDHGKRPRRLSSNVLCLLTQDTPSRTEPRTVYSGFSIHGAGSWFLFPAPPGGWGCGARETQMNSWSLRA